MELAQFPRGRRRGSPPSSVRNNEIDPIYRTANVIISRARISIPPQTGDGLPPAGNATSTY